METRDVFEMLSILLETRKQYLDEAATHSSSYLLGKAEGKAEGLLLAMEVIIDANCI